MDLGAASLANDSAACPYPASVLDFLPLRGADPSAVELDWPCEVRTYWVRDLRPLVTVVRFIYAHFTLMVIILGMVLNCFALRVWSSRPMRNTSLAVYLRALSLSDMGALMFTYFLGYWRSHHVAFNTLFLNHEYMCRLHKILVSTFPMTSQWLQTALTVERLLVVWRPLRARNPAYPQVAVRAARRTVAVVYATLILVAVTKWHFSGFEQYSAFDYQRCERHHDSSVVAVYVYVALSTYLPGTLIFISNVMLFFRLRRSDSFRRSLFAGSGHDNACYSSDAAARTLVLFSLLYLLLQLPLGVVETIELYWDTTLAQEPSSSGPEREAYISWLCRKLQLKWSRSLLFWLFQLSFVLNFVVYLKSGGRFRAVAKDLAWQWLCLGLRPVRSAGSSLRSLRRHLGLAPLLPASPLHASAEGVEAVESLFVPGGAIPLDVAAPAPALSTCGSTGSISSDSSGGALSPESGLNLCWRRARSPRPRQPRPRIRAHSCPHRAPLRRTSPGQQSPWQSPCRTCQRTRLHSWTTFIRSQGLMRRSSGGSRVPLRHDSSSPATTISDMDSSVFVSPPTPQQDVDLMLQDLGSPYASPTVFLQQDDLFLSSPLQDSLTVYSSVPRSRQDSGLRPYPDRPDPNLLFPAHQDFGSAHASPSLFDCPSEQHAPQLQEDGCSFSNPVFCHDLLSSSPPQVVGDAVDFLREAPDGATGVSPWAPTAHPQGFLGGLAGTGRATFRSECELRDAMEAVTVAGHGEERLAQRRATVGQQAKTLGRYLSEPHR